MSKNEYVYCITTKEYEKKKLYKIGKTSSTEESLLSRYDTHSPEAHYIIKFVEVWNYKDAEKLIHYWLKDTKIKGEWFKLTENDIESVFNNIKYFYPSKDKYWEYYHIERKKKNTIQKKWFCLK